MKKHLSLAAALIVLLSLTGCSAKNSALSHEYGATDIGGRPSAGTNGAAGGMADDGIVTEAADMATGGAMTDGTYIGAPKGGEDIAPVEPGDIDIDIPEPSEQIPPQAGLLTGGEWNDNAHWADWQELYESHEDWNGYKSDWRIKRTHRLAVKVQNEKGEPIEGAAVSVGNWMKAITDNKGMAYLFGEGDPMSLNVTAEGADGYSANWSWNEANSYKDTIETVTLTGGKSSVSKKLDLMIMCDTTGSMSDELEYLKEELSEIVRKIKSENANIPTRVSVNFYRDETDEYEVRQFPFSEDIDKVVEAIGEQTANGGGDFPEAVHTALNSAVNGHEWDNDSVKIMFLVLDAPPHSEEQVVDSVNDYVLRAAEMGIRIVPIASSGIDKSTEYLLRTMAFTTGGTYTFLTDDSGIGGEHIEPTVGAFNVEKLSDMMVRIVGEYLK